MVLVNSGSRPTLPSRAIKLFKWDDWKNYPESVRQGVTYKGKVYGIPYGLDTRFLYYRKDVFQKAGLDPNWQPKNVNDILKSMIVQDMSGKGHISAVSFDSQEPLDKTLR